MKQAINWDKIPTGSNFTAQIGGEIIKKGKIFKDDEGTIFLCQDVAEGAKCVNRQGFKYSWSVGCGNNHALNRHDVFYLKVQLPNKGFNEYIFKPVRGAYINIHKIESIAANGVKIGCTFVPYIVAKRLVEAMEKLKH